jgi:hypothetical protein
MPTHKEAELMLPLEDFLNSGHMRSRALVTMTSPEDLLTDHLPPFDCGDEDETKQAFAEACEVASDHALSKVRLDDGDLRFVHDKFLRAQRFKHLDTLLPVPV